MQRNETTAMYIELLFLRDPPLVKATRAQRFALGALRGGRPPEFDDFAHAALLLSGRPN